MAYCTYQDVLNETGIDLDTVIKLSKRHSTHAQVQSLINGYIEDAQEEIQGLLHIYTIRRKEEHLCTGEDDVYELGPEDEEGYIDYDVENCLIDVVNVYLGGLCGKNRRLRPYPTDCELGTESSSDWTGTATISTSTTRKAGTVSISAVYANATQYARYPDTTNDSWINKNIDPFGFFAFYARTSVNNTTVTVRLFDKDGNYNEASYKLEKKNLWYLVMFDLDEDFTSTVDWDDLPVYYVEYRVDKACTLLIDNANFNDEWMYTAPAGEVALMRRMDEEPRAKNYVFAVTYRYDPYLVNTPRNIKKACACLAGVDLIDFLRGVRQKVTEFEMQSESGVSDYSVDQLGIARKETYMKYEEALKSTGFGFEFTPIRGE